MPGKDKSVADAIQSILDKDKALFMSKSRLSSNMNKALKDKCGIKSNDGAKIFMKKLEAVVGDRFMFRWKGGIYYIMLPCDPAEIVLSRLASKPSMTPKGLAYNSPLTYGDISAIVNELIADGRVGVKLNEKLEAHVYAVKEVSGGRGGGTVIERPRSGGEYTMAEFRRAYDELHREWEFVRICDLRRALNWPRGEFDEMLRSLRNSMTVQLMQADESLMTKDEIRDCWIDENNYRMGTMFWNDR